MTIPRLAFCAALALLACDEAHLTPEGKGVRLVSSDSLVRDGCAFRGVAVAHDKAAVRNEVAAMGANTALIRFEAADRPVRGEAFLCARP